jgi:hypothetical protein
MFDTELDKRIAPLVIKMQSTGFDTISSCEGHFQNGEYRHVRPNVIFQPIDRGLLHSWIREVSRTPEETDVPPIEFLMFPVWDSERDVIHEDNWMVWIDLSQCNSLDEAKRKRSDAIDFLVLTLRRAVFDRPSYTDSFVRSRW